MGIARQHEPVHAAGDGHADDTEAVQAAIDAAASDRGVARVPPGVFRCGTLHLRSGVDLVLDAGARLLGTDDLDRYTHFRRPGDNPETQGDRWHRAMILAEGVEDASITGEGTIDGGDVRDDRNEEKMRGPHTVLLGSSRRVRVAGVTIARSANYAVLAEYSDDLEFVGVRFRGGWDGVHARGHSADRPMRRVTIDRCDFQTGDDAIAGRYWADWRITGCSINSSCNGVRVIGPVERVTIAGNAFHGPGRFPHITQDRTNALAGVLIQPGAWDPNVGLTDAVLLADNTMTDLQAAFAVATTPGCPVGRVGVAGLTATGVYGCGVALEGLDEAPIERVTLRDVAIDYAASAAVDRPLDELAPADKGVRAVPAWGLYADGVETLDATRVDMRIDAPDARPGFAAGRVGTIAEHDCRYRAAKTK